MPRKSARKQGKAQFVSILLVVVLFVVAFGAGIASLGGSKPYSPPEVPWLTFEDPDDLGIEAQAAIIRAAQLWTGVYGPCPQPVSVSSMDLEMKGEDYVLDRSEPGRIAIVPDRYVFDTALHSFTHACAGDVRSVLPVPFREGDIIGFRGLGIHVILTSGEDTYYMMIEEGIAERNAFCANNSFNPGTDSYQRLLAVSLQLFPCGDDAVVEYLKTSDVRGMAAHLFGKPEQDVVMGDITYLMDIYMAAYLGQ